MKRSLSALFALILILTQISGISAVNYQGGDTAVTAIFNPDYKELISRSDISYTGRISSGTQGITVANGRLGGPVWQSSGSTLTMQLNHTDVFTFSDSSSVSKDHSNDGGGGVGRVHIDFGGTVFGDSTQNRLSMYEGKLDVTADGVSVEVYAHMNGDGIILAVTDRRENPKDITVDLTMLRPALRDWGAHQTLTELSERNGMLILKQTITEPCDTGISSNDYYNSAALALSVQGRTAISVKSAKVGGRDSLKLTVPAGNNSFAIVIGGDASMDKSEDVLGIAVKSALAASDYEKVLSDSVDWWADFWNKSYVYLPSQSHFEQRRNYYLYLSAISNRGSYPSKYNGGIWLGEEDRRDWGSFYWNWNQDSLYQGLITANHLELMDPLFAMRESLYDNYSAAAKQMFGAEGIYIPETSGVLGWEILPDDIAQSVSDYYTFKTDRRSSEFTEMTHRRNPFLSVWNWNVFGGDSQASFVSHSLVATQETAEYYWQRYCYTGDLEQLGNDYKFIKGGAELYRTYDGFRMEEDGYYHIYNTNLHEHIWAGKDCIDDLALARGVFSAAIKASELLGVDAELRRLWQDCLDNLAPYPLRSDEGALYAGSTNGEMKELIHTDEPAFAQGLEPAFFIRDLHGTESPIFKMLEKFDVLTLETKDQGVDKGVWDIAMNTYLHSPGYVNQVIGSKVDQNGSSRFHVDAARLGMGDDLGVILNTQYHVFTVNGIHPNLLFDQLDYYSIEGYGTFSAALQEGLNQSVAPTPDGEAVIRVFPAWPNAWDAKYKLLAKDGFLVSSSIKDHNIEYVEITSQLGGECRVRNPWDGKADLYINGKKIKSIGSKENDLLTFDTQKGDIIVLVKKGTHPDDFRTSEITCKPYHTVDDSETNIVYGGKWKQVSSADSYLGTYHQTTEKGAYAEYTFTGNGFELITSVSPKMGRVEIYIDGRYQTTVDCSSADTRYGVVSYRNSGLKYEYTTGGSGYQARHTVKLVNKDGKLMTLDGIKILTDSGYVEHNPDRDATVTSVINDNDPEVRYVNSSSDGCDWFYTANRSGEGAYNSDAHILGNSSEGGSGSYCELTFYGSGIEVLTEKYNDMGLVRVYLDGKDMGEFDCYTSGERKSQDALYYVSGLDLGEHTLRLEKVSGQYMIIDCFRVESPLGADSIKELRILRQPALSYRSGDRLELGSMLLNALYESGVEKNITFDESLISSSPLNGTHLTLEDNGRQIVVSYNGIDLTLEPLTVTSKPKIGLVPILIGGSIACLMLAGIVIAVKRKLR